MSVAFLYKYIQEHRFAVISTVSIINKPESAVVGIAVTPDLRLIFDTLTTTRKYENILQNPHVSFVIGWENEKTLQYEGRIKIIPPEELSILKEIYFRVFPDGIERMSLENITYVVVEPEWIRYSDFTPPQSIEEINFPINR